MEAQGHSRILTNTGRDKVRDSPKKATLVSGREALGLAIYKFWGRHGSQDDLLHFSFDWNCQTNRFHLDHDEHCQRDRLQRGPLLCPLKEIIYKHSLHSDRETFLPSNSEFIHRRSRYRPFPSASSPNPNGDPHLQYRRWQSGLYLHA